MPARPGCVMRVTVDPQALYELVSIWRATCDERANYSFAILF